MSFRGIRRLLPVALMALAPVAMPAASATSAEQARTGVTLASDGRLVALAPVLPGPDASAQLRLDVELQVSGIFFGTDYELELDQAGLEVLRMAAIPGLGRTGILLLTLLIAGLGIWVLRRTR